MKLYYRWCLWYSEKQFFTWKCYASEAEDLYFEVESEEGKQKLVGLVVSAERHVKEYAQKIEYYKSKLEQP